MVASVQIKRGTRAQIVTAAGASGLVAGEPYLITDENRLAVGLSATTYQDFAKQNEISHLSMRNIGEWRIKASTTTANLTGAHEGFTTSGVTAVARSTGGASTHLTQLMRIGYTSSVTTAGAIAHARLANLPIYMSNGSLAGFFSRFVFCITDGAAVAGARMFLGVSTNYSAGASNVEPSTLTNCIGVGHGASDTTLKIFYGGSSAQTPIDLGANFPADTRSTDVYEVLIWNPKGVNNKAYVTVKRYSNTTGTCIYESTTELTAATVGVQLPNSGQAMSPFWAYRTNNATALGVAFDLIAHSFGSMI
ncbi:MAG: hypothetical protein AAB680_05485 [Pseudomonadota bacterium]